MDISTTSHDGDTGAATRCLEVQTSGDHRRAKFVAALVLTLVVGTGSYAATYHALVLVSEPVAANGSVAPTSLGHVTAATVPQPVTPPPSQP